MQLWLVKRFCDDNISYLVKQTSAVFFETKLMVVRDLIVLGLLVYAENTP